jgi:hypothetical protein
VRIGLIRQCSPEQNVQLSLLCGREQFKSLPTEADGGDQNDYVYEASFA